MQVMNKTCKKILAQMNMVLVNYRENTGSYLVHLLRVYQAVCMDMGCTVILPYIC